MLMGSTDFYSEQLLDEARDDGTDQDIWMSIVYEDIPLAYIRMSEDEMDFSEMRRALKAIVSSGRN